MSTPPPEINDDDDPYATLGVLPNATDTEIKKAYRTLATAYHPDHNQDDGEEAEAQFKKVTEAHERLTNPDKRKAYDKKVADEKAAQEQREAEANEIDFSGFDGDAPEEKPAPGSTATVEGAPTQQQTTETSSPPHPEEPASTPESSPAPLRPPTNMPRSPGSEAGVVLALDELPPIDWGGARAVAARLIALVAALALLALPFCIVSAVGEANEYGLVLLGCFALFVVGLAAVAGAVGAIFSRD